MSGSSTWAKSYMRQSASVRALIVAGATLIAPLIFMLVNAFVWMVSDWRIMPAGWWHADRIGAALLFAFIGVIASGIAVAISEDEDE